MITSEDVYRIKYLMANNKLSYFTDEFFDSLKENQTLDNYVVYTSKCSLYSVIFSMIKEGLDFKDLSNLSDEFIINYVKKELSDELINKEITDFVNKDTSRNYDFHDLSIEKQNFATSSSINSIEVSIVGTMLNIIIELSL